MNGIRVTGTFKPTSELDTFPVTDEKYHKGGYRSVADSAERFAITKERRSEGMLVREVSSGYYYVLEGGIEDSNWKRDFTGTSGGSTVELKVELNNSDLW